MFHREKLFRNVDYVDVIRNINSGNKTSWECVHHGNVFIMGMCFMQESQSNI